MCEFVAVSDFTPSSYCLQIRSSPFCQSARTGFYLQGNGGYSSGDDSPQRHTSNNTYSRPTIPQDSHRSPLTAAPAYGQPQASPSGRGGDEAHLVDDMCTPGGLRAQPDREDLRLFVENAASLNGTTVAELLQAKMVCVLCPLLAWVGRATLQGMHPFMAHWVVAKQPCNLV